MGSRGPVPKRSSERRRRGGQETETVEVAQAKPVAPPPKASWHRIARDWYRSLKESGQSQFYEPSDWQRAYYVAELISRSLSSHRVSSSLVTAVMSGMSDLLDTEASRRRVGLEITRRSQPKLASVSAMDDYRRALES
jgi:hypothetical protein